MLTTRAGLQAFTSGVALHETGFISAAMERGDHLTGQSDLKCAGIPEVLPADHIICTVKVCESHFANWSSRA